MYGPITYDVVSLFRDAFISWEEERVLDWTVRYWEKAQRAPACRSTPTSATFYRDFEWMGLQRHLKVLGIFARLKLPRRQGRLPRGHAALRRATCAPWRRATARSRPLLRLLDALEGVAAQRGYTF